jgi:hypothetical protein
MQWQRGELLEPAVSRGDEAACSCALVALVKGLSGAEANRPAKRCFFCDVAVGSEVYRSDAGMEHSSTSQVTVFIVLLFVGDMS